MSCPKFDLGDFTGTEDLVVFEIRVQHVAGVAVHNPLLEERVGDALQDAAVDLADDTRGVDGTAAVVRAEDLLDVHASGLGVDGEFVSRANAFADSMTVVAAVTPAPFRNPRRENLVLGTSDIGAAFRGV
jgi:hypothetical protein